MYIFLFLSAISLRMLQKSHTHRRTGIPSLRCDSKKSAEIQFNRLSLQLKKRLKHVHAPSLGTGDCIKDEMEIYYPWICLLMLCLLLFAVYSFCYILSNGPLFTKHNHIHGDDACDHDDLYSTLSYDPDNDVADTTDVPIDDVVPHNSLWGTLVLSFWITLSFDIALLSVIWVLFKMCHVLN